jgi:hypothetical protein
MDVGVLLDPVYKCIFSINVLVNARSFENGIEGFLSIRLDDVLFVLHQFDDALEVLKIAKPYAH